MTFASNVYVPGQPQKDHHQQQQQQQQKPSGGQHVPSIFSASQTQAPSSSVYQPHQATSQPYQPYQPVVQAQQSAVTPLSFQAYQPPAPAPVVTGQPVVQAQPVAQPLPFKAYKPAPAKKPAASAKPAKPAPTKPMAAKPAATKPAAAKPAPAKPAAAKPQAAAKVEQHEPKPVKPAAAAESEDPWRVRPLLVVFIIFGSVIFWQKRRLADYATQLWKTLNPPDKVATRNLVRACRSNNPAAATTAWTAWQNSQAEALQPTVELLAAATELHRHVYGALPGENWQGASLAKALSAFLSSKHQTLSTKSKTSLPPLNP